MFIFHQDNKIELYFEQKYILVYKKVLEFTLQVLINCEHQINKYNRPCGTMLSSVASSIKSQIKDRNIEELSPCAIFYCAALSIQNYEARKKDSLESGLSLFLIFLADSLLDSDELSLSSFVLGLNKSLNLVEKSGWKDGMLTNGIEPFILAVERNYTDGCDTKYCIQAGASAAELAARNSSNSDKVEDGDAGAHSVGVFTRALYQAINISL